MKVRVPKELRPPSRFEAFADPLPIYYSRGAKFRCTGKFRLPNLGEYFWGHVMGVVYCQLGAPGPRVILEKLEPVRRAA